MDKHYLSYQRIHNTIKDTAEKIITSGFEPDLIVAISGGGLIPARILRTYIKKPIVTVGITYYDQNDQPMGVPQKTQWLDEEQIDLTDKKVLVVDEVDDSRVTLEYCLKELLHYQPSEIAVFVLHNKVKTKRGHYPSEIRRIYVGEELSDNWICYPWDGENIDEHELLASEQQH